MNKLNLILVISNLTTGGAEIMLFKLLQQLDRTRFNPTVISLIGSGEMGPRIQALGIPVHTLGMQRGGVPSPLALLHLTRLLRQLRPDVVNTWMYHADLLGGLAARMAGCPRILWGLHNSDLSNEGSKRSTLRVVKLCAWLSHQVPAGIISCSQRAKEVHVAQGYAAERMQFIPNGFDVSQFAPDATARSSVRAELGVALNTPLVGLIARFDPQKNHFGFVEAAALVHRKMPQVHFVLAGAGVDAANEALVAAVAHQGLQANMHLLGRRDDVPRLMAALDVMTSSSSYGEAFPMVLGEAMACGVPCAVTDVGDSADIVGSTGRVVPAGDMQGLAKELLALLQLPSAERATLGQQARQWVQEHYEIGHVARLYEAAYEQVARSA